MCNPGPQEPLVSDRHAHPVVSFAAMTRSEAVGRGSRGTWFRLTPGEGPRSQLVAPYSSALPRNSGMVACPGALIPRPATVFHTVLARTFMSRPRLQ